MMHQFWSEQRLSSAPSRWRPAAVRQSDFATVQLKAGQILLNRYWLWVVMCASGVFFGVHELPRERPPVRRRVLSDLWRRCRLLLVVWPDRWRDPEVGGLRARGLEGEAKSWRRLALTRRDVVVFDCRHLGRGILSESNGALRDRPTAGVFVRDVLWSVRIHLGIEYFLGCSERRRAVAGHAGGLVGYLWRVAAGRRHPIHAWVVQKIVYVFLGAGTYPGVAPLSSVFTSQHP